MVSLLAWVAFALGGLVLLYALLDGRREKDRLPAPLRPLLLAALLLLLAGALLTLPTAPPWSPGQALWPALLLGGGVVAAGVLAGGGAGERAGYRAAAAQVGAATLGVAALALLFGGTAQTPLAGFAFAALLTGLLAGGGARLVSREEAVLAAAGRAEGTAFAAAALAATTTLAAYHLSAAGERAWLPLPALFGAALAVGLLARAFLAGAGGPGWLRSLLAVFVPLGVVAWLAGGALGGPAAFPLAAGAGAAVFALIAWLDDPERPGFQAETGLLAALLALGGALLAFHWLHGTGIGIALLAGVAVAAAFPGGHGANGEESERRLESLRHPRPLLRGALVLALLLVLYRVYLERYGYLRGLQTEYFYSHAALIAGALLPALLAGFARGRETAVGGSLLRVGLPAFAAVAAPLAVWLLLGGQAQAALVVGLAVGAGFLLAGFPGSRERDERALAWQLALLMALAALLFTHLLEPLAGRTRAERVLLLAVVAVVPALWILVTAWLDRRPRGGERVSG